MQAVIFTGVQGSRPEGYDELFTVTHGESGAFVMMERP
jgi:hypothetical protein